MLQAGGIALACASGAAAALVGAVLFGGTFIGVSTLALRRGTGAGCARRGRVADGRLLGWARSWARCW